MATVRDVRVESVSPLRLRLLLEVQRRRSIAAAADACAVGQPSASMHLRMLEAATGRMLLHRNGRGSGLTSAGSVVASHAARILAVLDEMRDELETREAGAHGTLSIAASETACVAVLPGALQRFAERHPGVAVAVTSASWPPGTSGSTAARPIRSRSRATPVPPRVREPRRRDLRAAPEGGARGMSAPRSWWGPVAIASAIIVGVLYASGTHSPVRLAVTLWFLLVCPGMALVRLLRLDDVAAELALAVAVSIALAVAAGGVLLYSGRWSPGTALVILIATTVIAAAAPLARARPLPRTRPWRRP